MCIFRVILEPRMVTGGSGEAPFGAGILAGKPSARTKGLEVNGDGSGAGNEFGERGKCPAKASGNAGATPRGKRMVGQL